MSGRPKRTLPACYRELVRRADDADVRYAIAKADPKARAAQRSGAGWVRLLGRQCHLLWRMVRDSARGEFKAPWRTIAAAAAALVYFINPLDLVPDFLPGVGLLDDATVVGLCLKMVRDDLKRYARQNDLDLDDYGLR